MKQSTGHTHTGHTDRENTPDTGTRTRTTRPPNEHLPQELNNAQRWRDDGAEEAASIYLGAQAYIWNTQIEEYDTVFYSYLAYFMNTSILNIYVSMSYTGVTRQNTVFVFLWLHPGNT